MNKQSLTRCGFSILELVMAVAIFFICMVFVFQYSHTMRQTLSDTVRVSTSTESLARYSYGNTSCYMFDPVLSTDGQTEDIDLDGVLSTSTVITGIFIYHRNDQRNIIFVTDSASTTEPDVYIGRLEEDGVSIDTSIDVGPGIKDGVYMPPYLFVANTSVNSHIKVFRIDADHTGTSSKIQEIQNIKINSLSQSSVMPRTLAMFGSQLVLGTEKNNAGGELFFLNVSTTTMYVDAPHVEIELGGQAHQVDVFNRSVLVTTAADPELKKFSFGGIEESQYDAPLSIGNGKSVISLYPYVLLGRTLGSGELTLLDKFFSVLDTTRTYGSIDAIEPIHSESNSKFLVFTANSEKELQIWFIGDNGKLSLKQSYDLPGRMATYACDQGHLYIILSIATRQHLLIL